MSFMLWYDVCCSLTTDRGCCHAAASDELERYIQSVCVCVCASVTVYSFVSGCGYKGRLMEQEVSSNYGN